MKAFPDCKRLLSSQFRNGIGTLFKMVIGNHGVQMMDMVVADITGKPAANGTLYNFDVFKESRRESGIISLTVLTKQETVQKAGHICPAHGLKEVE